MKTSFVTLLTVFLMCVVLASPALADTRTGTANPTSLQSWSFFNFGNGEAKITLSWTRAPAQLIMVLVCGLADPISFGTAAAGLDRYAEITAGVPENTTCLVGVTSARGSSPYRIHFNQTVSEISQGQGRSPLSATDTQLRGVHRFAEQEAARVKQLIFRNETP